jgi:two-component system CheB/CheR fusion protein
VTEAQAPQDLEELLQYLKQARGFDFTGYKRPSLQRRIDKRIRTIGVSGYDEYVDYLEVHPTEFISLFNAILINVTGFFRDAPTWTYLRDEVLPAHLERIGPDARIRAWSAGCASGEEAYSLAISLTEILGPDDFKRRVKIYGTDVDEEALQVARQAVYTERQLEGVSDELRAKYFEPAGERFTFRPDLRRSIIFGHIDLLRDAPISRLELLLCRNTLMYFNSETQVDVLERFHFALNDGGIFMVGRAETPLSRSKLFEPVDRKRRIFRKIPIPGRERDDRRALGAPAPLLGNVETLAAAAFDAAPVASIVLDRQSVLVHANERARRAFGIDASQAGRPFQDLEVSYRPVELRTPIERAYTERRTVVLRGIEWLERGDLHSLDVEVTPLLVDGEIGGVQVVFIDLTQQRQFEEQLRQSNRELEHAYEEVQSTNEELETTNEELQSTIEELETTNEELQSTNEELETMNEELQSTNDELHLVNEEGRVRGDEVEHLNRFLGAILTSFRGGVAVLDKERCVRVWNAGAEDLWGLRREEVEGHDFLELDSGLPVRDLAGDLEACLRAGAPAERTLDAVTRRGRHVSVRITINPFAQDGSNGAIVVTEVEDPV